MKMVSSHIKNPTLCYSQVIVRTCCLWPQERISRNTEDVAPVDDKYEEARLGLDSLGRIEGGKDFHGMQLRR